MKRHPINTIRQSLAALALFTLTCLSVQAAPYFTNKESNLIWDKATGLVWMRCSVGQTWDGKTCAGEAKKFTFDGAQAAVKQVNANGGYAGYKDWTVPSIRQLASLIACSNGRLQKNTDVMDGKGNVEHSCPDGAVDPTLDPVAFPNLPSRWVRSSSPNVRYAQDAWGLRFESGRLEANFGRNDSFEVWLVRTGQLLSNEATLVFTQQLPAPDQRAWAHADTTAKAAYAQSDAKRKAILVSEKLAQQQTLKDKGPQQLYLLAGQAQRGKEAEVNGKRYSATELYEFIVQNFPQSEFAVKASDQLTAMSRSEASARAAREGEERRRQQQDQQRNTSRQQCQAQKQTCLSQCPELWNSGGYACQGRCNAISCN